MVASRITRESDQTELEAKKFPAFDPPKVYINSS